MGPQFVLAGIPTAQIGHETFEDILVKNQLIPSITNVDQFINCIPVLACSKKQIDKEIIFESLGFKINWLEILNQFIRKSIRNASID